MYTAEENLRICDSVTQARDVQKKAALHYGTVCDSIMDVKDSICVARLRADQKHFKKMTTISTLKSVIIIGLMGYILLNLII